MHAACDGQTPLPAGPPTCCPAQLADARPPGELLAGRQLVVRRVADLLQAQAVRWRDDELAGPSAIAFVHGDTVTVAKALRDFSKANPLLVVKGGYFDGAPLTAEEVGKLADLESREVLLAKLAGLFKAPLFGAAYLFQAPLSKAVRTVDALREKQESAS